MFTQRRIVLILIFLLLYGGYFLRNGVRFWNEGATDFPAYYYAAKAAFHEGSLPYDRSTLQKIAVRDGRNADEVLPFLYPPPSLIIFFPFINLDYETARRLMLVSNLVLVLILLYLICKILGEKPGGLVSILALLYAVFFVPLTITISYGQINILVSVFICGAWYLAKEHRHPIWVALLLALAIILKLYPILLLVPFWLRREYKTVAFTLLTLVILIGLTILVLPRGVWNGWYENVGSVGYGVQVLGVRTTIPSNQSLYGFLARLLYGSNKRFSALLSLPEQVAAFVPYVVIGLFLATSLLVSFISRKRSTFDLQMSFWLVISYLIAPISWHHHMVFVFPAILITLYGLIDQKRDFKTLIPVALFALFWLYDYPSNLPAFRQGFNTLLMSVPLYVMLVFWALLVFLLSRERPTRQAELS